MEVLSGVDMMSLFNIEEEFDMNYGVVEPPQTILVRAYSDDSDDSMLTELRPRFIIMFDPSLEFIRRVEVGFLILSHRVVLKWAQVYRSSSPGLPVRMYFLMYQACCEEHKFLLSLRREKNSFTKLIQEYSVCIILMSYILMSYMSLSDCVLHQKMPIFLGDSSSGSSIGSSMLKTISTRLAGGRKELNQEPSKAFHSLFSCRSMALTVSWIGYR
jgi:DNA excision repair protein ERCC-4